MVPFVIDFGAPPVPVELEDAVMADAASVTTITEVYALPK